MQEKLVEYARHGSIKCICYKFQSASAKSLLDDKQTLISILESVTEFLCS